jgi:hypothetical protein
MGLSMKIKDLLESKNITLNMLYDKDCMLCFINDLAKEVGFEEPFKYYLDGEHIDKGIDINDFDIELKIIRKKGDIPHPL